MAGWWRRFRRFSKDGGAGDRYSRGQIIPLRNRFTASTDRTARIQIAQFGNAEIIADFIDGLTEFAWRIALLAR
jgi:hypothetical protein